MKGQDEQHDLAAEQSVLGAMLLKSDVAAEVTEILTADDYYRPAHQIIHEAIVTMREHGEPVDTITVKARLEADGTIAKVGTATYLHDLIHAVPTVANAGHYARIVRDLAERRQIIRFSMSLAQRAANRETDLGDVQEAIRRMAGKAGQNGGTGAVAGQSRRLVLTPASHIKPRPVKWGWEDRLPAGHISLIPGREGIGKSLFLIWLTAQITQGTLPGTYSGSPRPVFYCATEDSWQHTIAPRLIAARADLELVYRVEVEMMETAAAVQLYLPQDCDLLADRIKRHDVAMVALDPLMSALDPSIDTHNDRELRTALEPLAKMADDTGCMITGLAHFNKSVTDDPLTLVTGSRAFTAVVRSVVAVARDPDAEDGACVISQVKNNLGQLDLPNLTYIVQQAIVETDEGDARVGRLHFTGESEKSVRDILAEAGNGAERTERAECADWLRQALTAPRRTKEIEDEGKSQGFSQRTQYRARKQVGVKAEQLATGPKGRNEWWLSLPAEAGRHDPA